MRADDVLKDLKGLVDSAEYEPEYCKKLLDCARVGKSLAQFCSEVDTTVLNAKHWASKNPEFALAVEKAKTIELAFWEDQLTVAAIAGSKGNANALLFVLKKRFPEEYGEATVQVNGTAGPGSVSIIFKTVEDSDFGVR